MKGEEVFCDVMMGNSTDVMCEGEGLGGRLSPVGQKVVWYINVIGVGFVDFYDVIQRTENLTKRVSGILQHINKQI